MAEQAHTPGPWFLYRHFAAPTDRFDVVGKTRDDDVAENLTEANARLIAAAPELLAALRLYAFPGNYTGRPTPDQQRDQARAAICKAEGGAS